MPIVCAANGLQVDGQNDNGWDQGLLFMNSWQVWNQPPGIVTRMISDQRLVDSVEVESNGSGLDVFARVSADRKVASVQVVNVKSEPVKARLLANGLNGKEAGVVMTELSGRLSDVNTSEKPARIAPRVLKLGALVGGAIECTFAPDSVTVLRIE